MLASGRPAGGRRRRPGQVVSCAHSQQMAAALLASFPTLLVYLCDLPANLTATGQPGACPLQSSGRGTKVLEKGCRSAAAPGGGSWKAGGREEADHHAH
jgi:hypothetical protein